MNILSGISRNGLYFILFVLSISAHAQTTHFVTVSDSSFSPSSLTIQVGDTVRFTNAPGGVNHNVTSDNGSFQPSVTSNAFTHNVTFNQAGVFGYHCTIHGGPGFGMSGTITVEGGGGGTFDLQLDEVSANNDISYAPGDPLPLEAEVTNVGAATSPSYTVDFYISTDTNITTGDTLLGSSNRNALGAGNDDNINVNLNVPGNISGGNYFVGAIIDVDDANNGNNSNFEDEPINVVAGPAPADLALQSVSVPNGPFELGQIITIQSNVQNIGGSTSGAYTLTFYASENNLISDTDTPIGSVNRTALAAGASNSAPFMATIPANLPPGNYFFGAIVSGGDGNTNNNSNFDSVAVQVMTPSGPGFVINNGLNDAWFNDATPGQGFFITVFPDGGTIFLAWFTYDTERPDPSVVAILGEPGHRWLTAFGSYASSIAILDIELTEGGVFDSAEPMPGQDSNYGTIEIEFIDCNNAILTYDIPSLGLMGEIPITRIALDNIPACLAAQPQ